MAWGLDFELQACIDGAPHEHIGIVDTQWVVHNKIPSLGTQVSYNTPHDGLENLTQFGFHTILIPECNIVTE
jgi:hypothetical protein